MQLDNRSRMIFDELMENPSTTSKELEEGYSLTRRQLGYSFDKINSWLQAKRLPIIERTRQGHFIIDHSIFLNYGNGETIASSQMTIISEAQRVQMIILMLLSKQEELSLLHFTSALDVSKNTVLSDLNEARVWVEEYELVIRYSRRDGYLLEGEEFSIRRLLINTIYKVLAIPNGKSRFKELANIHEKEVKELTVRLEKIERKLNLKFADAEIEAMPYSLLLVLRRMIDNKIETSFSIQYEELSDTKEYQATEEILFDIEDIPVQERLFITLRLLTTNVYWSEAQPEEPIPNLAQALDEMLHLFEKSAVVELQDRQQLLTKILLHLKPAYYRIKYQLTEINDVGYKLMKDEYKELYHLVSQSTKPLATLIGTAIPASEMSYLTMLIGGWLRKQGDNLHEKVKAIVVCPTDVLVSRVMFNELRELFPEFIFLDVVSVREFHSSTLDYDIVFSPFFLETDKKLYLANSFLKYEDKPRLRKHVLFDLHGYVPYEVNVDEMMTIMAKHVTIHNEALLRSELHAYINGLGKTK